MSNARCFVGSSPASVVFQSARLTCFRVSSSVAPAATAALTRSTSARSSPAAPLAPIAPVEAQSGEPLKLQWPAAGDDGSGVAGYRVYIGLAADGTSDWFTAAPQVEAPPLAPGSYLLRVQPIDYAGNAGAWTTIGRIASS